jgi:hypothetical protein
MEPRYSALAEGWLDDDDTVVFSRQTNEEGKINFVTHGRVSRQ